jgi:tetratricopeptide (TPR) repeat protein
LTSDRPRPEQVLQSILQNVQVSGNLTTGDISQIVNLFISINQPESFNPTGIPQNIPSSGTIRFVGRSEELERLHQMLQQNNQVVIAAIAGMGGVGKTELATQYALLHLLLLTYPGGICWLRARDENIGIQVVRFAQTELDLKPPENLGLPEQVRWCWRRWREGNVLVVLDDINDYPTVDPYLPPRSSRFKVLITTRLQLQLPQEALTLNVLRESAALELLRQWFGEERIVKELEDAKKLCQRLGYLPLALNLVGRYVKQRKIALAEMLCRLERKGLQHKSLEVDKNDRARTLKIERGVAAAFELSWEELSENAKQLGCLLSLFALAPIPWSLVVSVATGQDPENLEDAKIELESLHLLQGEETYRLHQLIREFLREKLEHSELADELKRAFAAAMAVVANQIPEPYSLTRELIFALSPSIPHLEEVTKHLTSYLSNKAVTQPFVGLGWFYESQVFYSQAERLYQECLERTQKRFGNEHPAVATSLNNLAYIYKSQGRYSEAEPLYVQALALRKKLLGEKHAKVAHSINNLAGLYRKQGRYSEAEPLLLESLALRKELLGEKHQQVAMSLDHLAYLYYEQGHYLKAEPLYLQALSICCNESHPYRATILNNLALLYETQERYLEAEPLYLKALEMRQRLLGEDHPDVANSLYYLATLYQSQCRYSKAHPLYEKALEIYEHRLGADCPWTAKVRENFVTCLKQAIAEGHADLEALPDNPTIQAILAEVQASLEQSE